MKIAYGFSVEPKGKTPRLFTQVHGDRIVSVADASEAERLRADPPEADGALTRTAGLEVYCFAADCIPVLLAAPGTVAAVHSGWRGTMKRVVPAALKAMGDPKNVTAILGPCIRSCCFEVKGDFVDGVRAAGHRTDGYLERRSGKLFFRLLEFLVETQLARVGKVDTTHARCTACSQPELPSFRRTKGTDPHLRAWIRLDAHG